MVPMKWKDSISTETSTAENTWTAMSPKARALQVVAENDPYGVLSARIDVVAAGVALVRAWGQNKRDFQVSDYEERLALAVRRYERALKERNQNR